MTAQTDRFVHDRLPSRNAWPVFIYAPGSPTGEQPLNLIHELLDKSLQAPWVDKVLFRDPTQTITYREAHVLVNQRAQAILNIGLEPGNRVLLRGVAAIAEAYLLYWGMVYLLARAVFRFPREWAAPLASGISICGVSAAMATGAAIRARSGVAVLVSSLVVVFSTIELVVLPFFARWLLPDNPMVAAAWMGLAVKTDGAAVAAGAVTEALYQPGPGNLMVATTTLIKVFIDLFIGVWCFVLAIVWQRWFRPEGSDRVRFMEIVERMPLFLIGYFLAFLGLMVLGNSMPETLKGIKLVEGQTEAFRKPLFALAFLSIGMATDLRRLASPGMARLLLVYLVSIFGFIIWMALAISWIFFHDIPAIPPAVMP
jgi:uncharacterized membrane protein YadS